MAPAFIRYRINTSASKGTWDYLLKWWGDWDSEQVIEHILDEENYDPDPQHYRGVQVEDIERPPIEWLREERSVMQSRIDELTSLVAQYAELLDE